MMIKIHLLSINKAGEVDSSPNIPDSGRIESRMEKTGTDGKLKIGDDWNAITIIALSQSNPLKAIAEFVENSIDARAKSITLIRGKSKGEYYLKIIDDGQGIGDFKYVATHIGDSIKRKMKKQGAQGLQGEFGIGLLSFWTVGENLYLTSTSENGSYKMTMQKNKSTYNIVPVKSLFENSTGTELHIYPLLPGIRQLSGEKMQGYLSSELRDRIKKSGVNIRIIDKTGGKEYSVEPREFNGRLLHNLRRQSCKYGEIYIEIYLNSPDPQNNVGLFKNGTRVIQNISNLEPFNKEPWNTGHLSGIIDAPFLQLTPGTREGIIYDSSFEEFCGAMSEISGQLSAVINEQRAAEEEKASRNILNSVKKAFSEAMYYLPREEYEWINIFSESKNKNTGNGQLGDAGDMIPGEAINVTGSDTGIPQSEVLFEIPGHLHKIHISPSKPVMKVGERKKIRVICKDRNKTPIEDNLMYKWEILEGKGMIENPHEGEIVFIAPDEPGISVIQAVVIEDTVVLKAEAIVTMTDSLFEKDDNDGSMNGNKGIPNYTFKHAAGELWRSMFDMENNLIIINSGNADFIYASKIHARKLRYICKIFSKELLLYNNASMSNNEILEKMIELSLYTEEHLK
jgi:hypothetical protein